MTRRYSHGSEWLLAMLGVMVGAACNGGRPNLGPDETPPELAFASEVPLYTRETSASLSVSAKDSSGVAKVWCQVGNGSAVPAERREDKTYSCGITLEHNAENAVVIWAVDGANNSGEGRDPPYTLKQTIVQSENALAVSLNGAAPATYYDETKMTVGTAVPPVYEHKGVGLVVLTAGATIHKAATRLASPTTSPPPPASPRPGDLEDKNPDNLPWLMFAVSLTGAPVVAASYSIEAKSQGTTKTYSGDLIPWRSPQSGEAATSGDVFFNLPLDSVLVPMLTTAAGPVAVKVAVEVTDEAGNKGGDEVELAYQVIGPPLNIVVDADYPKHAATNSTHYYQIANGSYGALFNAGDLQTFGPTQQVRLARIVVTNPAPEPVALDVPGITTGTWTITETWSGNQSEVTGTTMFNDKTCPGDNHDAANHVTMYAPLGGLGPKPPDPTLASIGWTGVAARAGLASLAELRDGSPLANVGTRYIVPAASGSAPAVVYLYVTRPLAVSRAGAPALGAAPFRNDMGTLYTYGRDTNSPSCCADGERWAPYGRCYFVDSGDRHYYCAMGTPAGRGWSVSCGGTPSLYGHADGPLVLAVCGTGPQVCPLGKWLSGPTGLNLVDTLAGPGNHCTNCTNTCSCNQWAPAQVYNTSTYRQLLSTATDALSLNFVPATQSTDENGNVYGVANPFPANVVINGSYSH
jgi:hypothetical protein